MKKLVQFAGIFILAATFFSCSNDNEPISEPQKSSLKLQLNYAKTKAIEDQSSGAAPTVTSAVITLKDGSNNTVYQTTLDPSAIAAINTNSLVLEAIPSTATQVEIIANGDISKTNINDYQKLTNGIKDVPYQGIGTITYTTGDLHTDGHLLKKVSIDMSAYLSRIEVIGGIPVTVTDNGLHAIDVEAIYINNISLAPNATPTRNLGDLINQNWQDEAVYTNANGAFRNMWDALSGGSTSVYVNSTGVINGKATAYQLFPFDPAVNSNDAEGVAAKMFHIILKVKAYDTPENKLQNNPLPNKNYITIRSIINEKTSLRVNKLERGMIYRVDLEDLKDYFKPDVTPPIDPEPEAGKVDLAVTATVLPWTIVNAKPEL